MNGNVILGFGPQPLDWFAKAGKIAGKKAVFDADIARLACAEFAAGDRESLDTLRSRLIPGALRDFDLNHNTDAYPKGAPLWLVDGERGESSNALFTRLSGINAVMEHGDRTAHPFDPADFRRCHLMLQAVPSLGRRLHEAKDLSPTWAALIGQWERLCKLFDEEAPDWRERNSHWKAPRLYDEMQSIIAENEK